MLIKIAIIFISVVVLYAAAEHSYKERNWHYVIVAASVVAIVLLIEFLR